MLDTHYSRSRVNTVLCKTQLLSRDNTVLCKIHITLACQHSTVLDTHFSRCQHSTVLDTHYSCLSTQYCAKHTHYSRLPTQYCSRHTLLSLPTQSCSRHTSLSRANTVQCKTYITLACLHCTVQDTHHSRVPMKISNRVPSLNIIAS